MLTKILQRANHPLKPLRKVDVIRVLRWQLVWLGLAFVCAVLDVTNLMQIRATSLLVFIFMALGLTLATYLHLQEAGLKGSEAS